jgi:hypothetical protein
VSNSINLQSNHENTKIQKHSSLNQFVASPRIPGSKQKILLKNPEGSGYLKRNSTLNVEMNKKVLRKGSDYIARSDK